MPYPQKNRDRSHTSFKSKSKIAALATCLFLGAAGLGGYVHKTYNNSQSSTKSSFVVTFSEFSKIKALLESKDITNRYSGRLAVWDMITRKKNWDVWKTDMLFALLPSLNSEDDRESRHTRDVLLGFVDYHKTDLPDLWDVAVNLLGKEGSDESKTFAFSCMLRILDWRPMSKNAFFTTWNKTFLYYAHGNESVASVAENAVDRLFEKHPEKSFKALVAGLENANGLERSGAVKALLRVNSNHPEYTQKIWDSLTDSPQGAQYYGIGKMGAIYPDKKEAAWDLLMTELKTPNSFNGHTTHHVISVLKGMSEIAKIDENKARSVMGIDFVEKLVINKKENALNNSATYAVLDFAEQLAAYNSAYIPQALELVKSIDGYSAYKEHSVVAKIKESLQFVRAKKGEASIIWRYTPKEVLPSPGL